MEFEGGEKSEEDEIQSPGIDEPSNLEGQYDDEVDDGADLDDPYRINQLHEIPHEDLKDYYTEVVDELLDLQLEFEDKLAEAEENA